jgi:hypothetical protein
VTKPPLGSGARFRALSSKLASRGGVKNPAALAASIGRKKYGKKRFASLGRKGKRRSGMAKALRKRSEERGEPRGHSEKREKE